MRNLALVPLLFLAGCPAPLLGCDWGVDNPGRYQYRTEAGGCIASNVDLADRIVVDGVLDLDIRVTGEAGGLVSLVTRQRAALVDDGIFCVYTDEIGDGECDTVRLACADGLDDPIPAPLASSRIQIIVNGEVERSLYVISERFATESGLE